MKPAIQGIRKIGKLLGETLIETGKLILNGIAALFYKCVEKSLSFQQKILDRILNKKKQGLIKGPFKNLIYFLAANILSCLVFVQLAIYKKLHILK